MQFKRAQREELSRSWNKESWFFSELGLPARGIIMRAYGLEICSPKIRTKCQEDVSMAVSNFARKIGAEKSHVTHAMLSGSILHLKRALAKKGLTCEDATLTYEWQNAFRELN
jgi:hypothetical protein